MTGLCKAGILGYTANPSAAWGSTNALRFTPSHSMTGRRPPTSTLLDGRDPPRAL